VESAKTLPRTLSPTSPARSATVAKARGAPFSWSRTNPRTVWAHNPMAGGRKPQRMRGGRTESRRCRHRTVGANAVSRTLPRPQMGVRKSVASSEPARPPTRPGSRWRDDPGRHQRVTRIRRPPFSFSGQADGRSWPGASGCHRRSFAPWISSSQLHPHSGRVAGRRRSFHRFEPAVEL
jgi:hypothetical protein